MMRKDVYEPGEWVLSGFHQVRGYVIKSDPYHTEIVSTSHNSGVPIKIEFVENGLGEKVPKTRTVMTSGLKLAPELPRVYSYDEINLALMTKDKEWYEDITSLRDRQEDGA